MTTFLTCNIRHLSLVILMLMATAFSAAAEKITVTVASSDEKQPVEFATVSLVRTPGGASYGGMTSALGSWSGDIPSGKYDLKVSYIGYQTVERKIAVPTNSTVDVVLVPMAQSLEEVVVTAREGRKATSVSLIDGKAMEHLQPSSFTDLVELLPGNVASDPKMGEANLVHLREAPNSNTSGNYDTSSLGTSFVVDGMPVNTGADMQVTSDANQSARITSGKGVDMRSISTDDIESVEIVRGIASAAYGESTSGVINIKRKSGITRLEARFKADMQSQLFYVGKGFGLPGRDATLNLSLDYLDSKVDPRNTRENFKRVTGSVRFQKKWENANYNTTFGSAVNYVGTFERDRNDPDLTINNVKDYFTSDNNKVSAQTSLVMLARNNSFFNSLNALAGITYSHDKLHQEKTIAPNRVYPLPISTTPGSHYVGFLPMVYEAQLDVIGKPLTAFAKGDAKFRYEAGNSASTLNAGLEWNMSKNYGPGQVYDPSRPISPGNTSRPRPFSAIPSMQQLSAFVENVTSVKLPNSQELYVQLGLRETQLLNLDSRYYLAYKPYFDPRANLKWTLPVVQVAGNPMMFELAGGIGLHTKMPVAAQLYPDPVYTDFVQLNYFHNEQQYRTMNVMTFVDDPTNYSLKAARNLKWEVRGDISFMGNRLSVTYFRERMNDGFRSSYVPGIYTYNIYDASDFDPVAAGRAPLVEELPATETKRMQNCYSVTNDSRTAKQGIEYTFSSRRIPVIRTRLTVSGAWFLTELRNSQPLWYRPSIVIAGKEMFFAGLYDDPDGNRYQSFNTNVMFDTDIPRLKLNFSISAQNMWFTQTQLLDKTGIPTHYMDISGQVVPFTEECASDPYLSQLVRSYASTAFEARRVPVSTAFNIKATKKLWDDRIGIALYVNRLFTIAPDYRQFGILQRRYSSPYFGMELNFRL